jgi:hypothetical protein
MIIETFNKEPVKKTRGETRLFLKLKCDECGEVFEKPWHKTIAGQDFHFHNRKCMYDSQKYGVLKEKKEQTCMKNHGVKYPAQSFTLREKQRLSMLETYGYSHNFSSPKLIEENRNKTIARNREAPSFASEEVKVKIRKALKEKYGVEHVSQIEDVKRKKIESVREHYGVDHPLQCREIMARKEQTCLERFGTKFPSQSEDVQQSIRENNIKKYGVTNPTKTHSVQEKMQLTCFERYGERHYSQSKDFIDRVVGTGFYEHGHIEAFDRVIGYRSSYEKRFLELLMAMTEEVIDVQQNVKFSYTHEGKSRRYFADFLVLYVSGKKVLYEVKPAALVDFPVNVSKFKAAREQIRDLGIDEFKIVTEQDLYVIGRID